MRFLLFPLVLVVLLGCKQSPISTAQVENTIATKDEEPDTVGLDAKIGQMIMIGIPTGFSLKPSDPLSKEIAEGKVGGVVLYEKNIARSNSSDNLKKLVSDIQKNATIPLFISIDEEGGLVHRMKAKYGFVDIPSAAYLGKINNTDTTYLVTKRLTDVLHKHGIDLNYAPDIDLAINPSNPVIAKLGRSFSADHEVVSKHALACIEAHHSSGVRTVIKHFPGHGSSTTDSHKGITDVTNLWNVVEIFPYYDLIKSGKVDGIMTAHIINCRLDSLCLPATLSKTIITGMLRNMLNFDGVVFSDDMQMYAISKNYGLENAIKLSINAGVDVVMFANNVDANDQRSASDIFNLIKKLVERGDISEERISEAYQRIMALKNKPF
jgi:beta-N-acetylhexosaminidase